MNFWHGLIVKPVLVRGTNKFGIRSEWTMKRSKSDIQGFYRQVFLLLVILVRGALSKKGFFGNFYTSKNWISWMEKSAENSNFLQNECHRTQKLSILQFVREKCPVSASNKWLYVLGSFGHNGVNMLKRCMHFFFIQNYRFSMIYEHLLRKIFVWEFMHFLLQNLFSEKQNPQTF